MRITGNKVLITGGTRGIGLALATRFLALGNQVIVTGRNAYRLDQLALKDSNLETFNCDQTNPDDLYKLAGFIEKKHPDLNILINNAGVQFNYNLSEELDAILKINEEIATNLVAPLHLTTSLIPVLERNQNSAIVNVSSALGIVPKQSAPVYSATKAAIHNFSKTLRYQLEGKIKVFDLIPALVDTDMTAGRSKDKITPEQLVDEFMEAFEKNHFEINIGKVKMLRLLHRIYPAGADRIMRRA